MGLKWLFCFYSQEKYNQSRMYGKVIPLGLFPSNLLESQSYDFDEIAHIKPSYVEKLHKVL